VLDQLRVIWAYCRLRWDLAARDEGGSVVEKVILTAIFAGLAIAAGAIIVTKVTNKAQSLNLNSP